jgi:hypothetical protein
MMKTIMKLEDLTIHGLHEDLLSGMQVEIFSCIRDGNACCRRTQGKTVTFRLFLQCRAPRINDFDRQQFSRCSNFHRPCLSGNP